MFSWLRILIILEITGYSNITANVMIPFSVDDTGHMIEIPRCDYKQIVFCFHEDTHVVVGRISKYIIKNYNVSRVRFIGA